MFATLVFALAVAAPVDLNKPLKGNAPSIASEILRGHDVAFHCSADTDDPMDRKAYDACIAKAQSANLQAMGLAHHAFDVGLYQEAVFSDKVALKIVQEDNDTKGIAYLESSLKMHNGLYVLTRDHLHLTDEAVLKVLKDD